MTQTAIDQFKAFVADVEARPGYSRPAAFALGVATLSISDVTQDEEFGEPKVVVGDKVLDTWYPIVNFGENYGTAALLADLVGHTSGSKTYELTAGQLSAALERLACYQGDTSSPHWNIRLLRALLGRIAVESAQDMPAALMATLFGSSFAPFKTVVTFIGDLGDKPVDVHDVYLRLHLLSHRKVQPRGLNLDGMIPLLPIVVWTDAGVYDVATWEAVRMMYLLMGRQPNVKSVDKFPRMVDYAVPVGVRIADGARVRLGAHLGEGTTVMHEGFANFNAGTLGAAMVEGRISAGVIVGKKSDIGGGASIMGTLSGGGTEVITIGEGCLIGANAGTGISLGDNCTIEAGCYITAGAKVTLQPEGTVVKAAELSGRKGLLYWRNSVTGAIEAKPNTKVVQLNEQLHQGTVTATPAP